MAVDRPRDEAVDVHCMARGRDIADSLAAAEEGRAVAVVDTVDGGPAVAAVGVVVAVTLATGASWQIARCELCAPAPSRCI